MVVSWVRQRYPAVSSIAEKSTATRDRRADVMLTWPDGRQAAVEIQYAALPVPAWQERHRSYLAQDITPIWLLGHMPPQMRNARPSTDEPEDARADQVRISTLHSAMIGHCAQVLWVNPIDRAVATPWVKLHIPGRTVASTPRADTERALVRIDALDSCVLDPERGLITPAMDALGELAVQYAEHFDAVTRRKVIANWSPPAEDPEEVARRQAKRELAQARLDAWHASELHDRFLRRFGEIPDVFSAKSTQQSQIKLYPDHWRCLLYEELIHGKASSYITFEDCFEVLDRHSVEQGTTRRTAVYGFLKKLAERGVVNIAKTGGGTVRYMMVIRPLEVLSEREDRLPLDVPLTK